MLKNILIVGHTGFLGKSFLHFLDKSNKKFAVEGISLEGTQQQYTNISLIEKKTMQGKPAKIPDFTFFLAHAQSTLTVCKEEQILAQEFVSFINKNNIESPIVLIKSVGYPSAHIRSRTIFNEYVKKNLDNKVYEVKSAIIASEGSISYEIPRKIISKMSKIPHYPWKDNLISLTTVEAVISVFMDIIMDRVNSQLLVPQHRNLSYKEYIVEIAKKEGRELSFFRVSFNDFIFTPFFISLLTGYKYTLVNNLMHTLKEDAAF